MNDASSIDEVLSFLKIYIILDHEIEVVQYVERDSKVFLPRIRRLEQCFAAGVSTGISASLPSFSDEERIRFAAKAARLVPRRIFKIKRWNHPQEGVLYQAYVGSSTPRKNRQLSRVAHHQERGR